MKIKAFEGCNFPRICMINELLESVMKTSEQVRI